jgi:23S rRNA pseudouridine1911/1915/1917 synthase
MNDTGTWKVVHVPEGLAGERVDAAIARMFGVSRTKAAELVADGGVTLDGMAPAKSDRVNEGAFLEVYIPAPEVAAVVPHMVDDLRIVYDDDAFVVVDKPVGVAAHPSQGWTGPTVLGHLSGAGFRISTSGVPERRGIVQRLDVATSGLMVVAKSEQAYSKLKRAFKTRTVDKTYHALVQGRLDPLRGTIDAPIARHLKHDYKFTVRSDGRASVTHYETLEAYRFASLLEIKLETGRTHQIRVHLAHKGAPCLGDPVYGSGQPVAPVRAAVADAGLRRQALHAAVLGFEHPRTGQALRFESPLPADMTALVAALRRKP